MYHRKTNKSHEIEIPLIFDARSNMDSRINRKKYYESFKILPYIYYIDSFILLLSVILNFLFYIDAKIISMKYFIIMMICIFIFIKIYEWAIRIVSEIYYPYGFISLHVVILIYISIWSVLFINNILIDK